MLDRTVKSAGQDLIRMPFQFDITTDEASPDTVRAVVLPAPVGADFETRLMGLYGSVEIEETPRAIGMAAAQDDISVTVAKRELLHLNSPSNRTLMRRVRYDENANETVMYFRDIIHELMVDRMKSEFLSMAAHERQTLQPIIENTVSALLIHGNDRKVAVTLPAEPIELDVDDEKLSQAMTNVFAMVTMSMASASLTMVWA